MELSIFKTNQSEDVIALYTDVFSSSEGKDEGKIIGDLVSKLIVTTQPRDLIGYVAVYKDTIVGCIFFSRFIVPGNLSAFLLSPLAVATEVQRGGVGQRLIRYGLEQLRSQSVDLVLTYGDPNFYSKTGFEKITVERVPAPYPLSQAIGWLGLSLTSDTVPYVNGETKCVEAFQNPNYW